jgi:hypothetical protein
MADQSKFTPIDHKSVLAGLLQGGRSRGARQLAGMVRNISNTFEAANPEHRSAGMDWYERAHEHAQKLSDKYGVNVQTASGVVSAMSPQKRWDTNKRLADQFLATGKAGHTGAQNRLATRIVEGEDPSQVLGRVKTGNFYRNIVDPKDASAVTIDRHAHDIAVGQRYGEENRGLGAVGRYGLFADAYHSATQHINRGRDSGLVLPHQVQAVTWTHWRGGSE